MLKYIYSELLVHNYVIYIAFDALPGIWHSQNETNLDKRNLTGSLIFFPAVQNVSQPSLCETLILLSLLLCQNITIWALQQDYRWC